MSLQQALIASQEDFDILVPSWQVGASTGSQCLKKSLRNCDVENLNVVKICENLCLAVNENSEYTRNHISSQNMHNDGKQCKRTPFRAFSNIWFGTLKIYQQQVNTLFRLSQDLFSRSCNYHADHLKSYKRKSSITYHKHGKKRRLTLSDSSKKTYIASYSQLLDDLEKLAQEPTENSFVEFAEPISASINHLRFREITIREISATSHVSPDIIEEDSGFGEATHEEIAEFFNFVEDNPRYNCKKIATKRKSSSGGGSPIKKACSFNDFSFEPLYNDNAPFCENKLKTSPIKSVTTPPYIIFDENSTVKNLNALQERYLNTNNILTIDKIKKEDISIKKQLGGKKRRKLIIDECIKIDILENISKVRASDLSIEGPRKTILKSYKRKRNIRAFELLTSFSRRVCEALFRSFKMSLSLKQKFYFSQEKFERNFFNLLREIFKSNFVIEWVSEIYPKWNCFEDTVLKQNKKRRSNKQREQMECLMEAEPEINILNENNNYNENHDILTTINYNMETINTRMRSNWRPYGLMRKLLSLWRLNQTNKITGRTLFKLAEQQIDRALGFNSLLILSKKRFVHLTSFPESIELQYILIGNTAKCNLTK